MINGEDMKNADCRMAGLSWAALFNPKSIEKYGYDCAEKCEYIKARKRAIKADVCIMTYQLFLFIMNNSIVINDYIEGRVYDIAEYTIATNATVRAAAKKFEVSKSTVHTVVTA